MNCKNCNNPLAESAKFCGKCGDIVTKESPLEKSHVNEPNATENTETNTPIIKCGNCGYIGAGEPARSLIGKILAWICVVFAPLITILYFVATHKWRCPKCKSTFLGVKNEHGVFVGQTGGASRIVAILVCILVGVAIMGILSSVVLVSLNSARQKGQDASVEANLANAITQAELYWDSQSTNGKDGSYSGLCNSDAIVTMIGSMPKIKDSSPVCNDSKQAYAMSSLLNSGDYWCIDSSGKSEKTSVALDSKTSCSPTDTSLSTESVNWSNYTSSKDGFSILFPKSPTLDSKENIPVTDSSMTYSWHNYEANDGTSSFFVFKYIYSDAIDVSDPDKILGVYLSSLQDSTKKLISSSYTYQSSDRALDFLIKATDEMIKGRFVLVGQTPYLAMMDYFPANYDLGTYNRFINSFKIQ